MSKTHLIIPDAHAHPDFHNKRAEWLGALINDVKPDVVVNIGDSADMPSLSSYDKGTKGFIGRNYKKDVEAAVDFEDRLWSTVKRQKKRLPYRVKLHGNHEQRIAKAINSSPELEGAISFSDLHEADYYDTVVPYVGNTPGIIELDGVHYAHYFVSGVMGRPIGGEHPAYSLLTKEFVSCTCGHIHVMDFAERTTVGGKKIYGCVAGVFQDYDSEWAGEVNKLWWRGVVVKRGVENGGYDPEFISLARLKKEYGK
jgi:hypothetical protein